MNDLAFGLSVEATEEEAGTDSGLTTAGEVSDAVGLFSEVKDNDRIMLVTKPVSLSGPFWTFSPAGTVLSVFPMMVSAIHE